MPLWLRRDKVEDTEEKRKAAKALMASKLTITLLQELSPLTPIEPADVEGQPPPGSPGSPASQKSEDLVTLAARDLLLEALKAQDGVKDVFFPDFVPGPGVKQMESGGFLLSSLATALVAQCMAQHKDEWGFHHCVDRGAVENRLEELYHSLHWKKLGFQLYTLLYPDVVRDAATGVRLRDYMGEDGHLWAEQLIAAMSQSTWTKAQQQRLVTGQCDEARYNQEVNAAFLKLHLLDPQSVIPAYQMLLNQRALPSVHLELATRNYLGGPLSADLLTPDVTAALARETGPPTQTRKSMDKDAEIDVTHGAAVAEWLAAHARNAELWSGQRPDNVRRVKVKDKCVVM